MSDESTASFLPGRRWSIGFNVLLSAGALLAIVVMANYLSARHFKRIERPNPGTRSLSPVTLSVLRTLTNQVKAVVFFSHRNDLYAPVISMLHTYKLRSPHLEIEDVDYERHLGRAKQALAELNLDGTIESDRVVFSANGRTKVVNEGELSDYENPTESILAGKEVRRVGFRGEQLFTAAIFSVTDPKPMKAYFLEGHDEHDWTDAKSQSGYGEFAEILRDNNLSFTNLVLSLDREVPEDCQLLIIAGPKHAVAPGDMEKLEQYLGRGGRILMLFNYDGLDNRTGRDNSGLPRLAANWGVEVGENFVIDPEHERASSQGQVLVKDFGGHPVVKPLLRSRVGLGIPRTVQPRKNAASGADAPTVRELLLTSPKATAARKAPRAVAEVSNSTLSLGVAVEKGTIPGLSPDHGTTRMIVLGDSFFLCNAMIDSEANRDFARNAVNWLLSREVLLEGIGSHPVTEYRISMTEREMRTVRWILLAGLPGGVLVLGWLVWLRRRS